VDRALWRLLFLHFRGTLRRRLRGLRTLRGWLLTLIGLAFVGGWVLLASHRSPLTSQEMRGAEIMPANTAREVFPPVLLLACLLTVAVSSGPAIYFSRAEIDFLFTGPFSLQPPWAAAVQVPELCHGGVCQRAGWTLSFSAGRCWKRSAS
jgi:hypothetical protein